MATTQGRRAGGRILVDQLRTQGVTRVFGVPGESYLAVLDALHDASDMSFVVCRQEGGAAMMAEADGKLTGRPGVAFVTRGPGATNASSGVHIAFQDSTPMILFVGQVRRDERDREAFQEVDYRRMYGALAKWVAEVQSAERLPEYLGRAFRTAMQGRPGPVVLALPEDMLIETADVADLRHITPVVATPAPDAMGELRGRLAGARRPLMIVGGGGWNDTARRDIEAFAAANDLPVAVSFRCQDYIHNDHPCYAGDLGLGANPELAERVRVADLLLVVGARLGEITTAGYSRPVPPRPEAELVHVHPDAGELGRVYQPDLAIQASSPAFAAAARELQPIDDPAWAGAASAGHRSCEAWQAPRAVPGALQMGEIVAWLRERLPSEAVIANGAGNYAGFVHRYYRFRHYRSQLAPTSGSMGYGVPAAIAAKLRNPDRPVVAFAGDGCFQMTGQELATAVQAGAAIIVIVVNNGMYGTIRMHQERQYPHRVTATDLGNPDFASLARAYGAAGETVAATGDFAPAFERALSRSTLTLIEVRLDPEAITPASSLGEIRAASQSD